MPDLFDPRHATEGVGHSDTALCTLLRNTAWCTLQTAFGPAVSPRADGSAQQTGRRTSQMTYTPRPVTQWYRHDVSSLLRSQSRCSAPSESAVSHSVDVTCTLRNHIVELELLRQHSCFMLCYINTRTIGEHLSSILSLTAHPHGAREYICTPFLSNSSTTF